MGIVYNDYATFTFIAMAVLTIVSVSKYGYWRSKYELLEKKLKDL